MSKLIPVAAAAFMAAPLLAQGAGGVILTNPEFQNGFQNRGQCEAALSQVRNSQRRDSSTRGGDNQQLSGSAFNQVSPDTTRCEQISGRYRVAYYRNGLPRATTGDRTRDTPETNTPGDRTRDTPENNASGDRNRDTPENNKPGDLRRDTPENNNPADPAKDTDTPPQR